MNKKSIKLMVSLYPFWEIISVLIAVCSRTVKRMNKKQLVCGWVGIGLVIAMGFVMRGDNFLRFIIAVTLVTSGIIYTLRDKKQKQGGKEDD